MKSTKAKTIGRPPHDDVLTPTEWSVVNWVRHGLTNQQIADRRGTSLDAVKYHVANAISKLQLDNKRALKRWRGAPKETFSIESNQGKATETGERSVSEYFKVGQVSRTVLDIAASEAWYRDVVQLPHLYTFGDLAFFDCGGTRLMLTQSDQVQAESVLYLQVDDIEESFDRLRERGAQFLGAPHMIHRHEDGVEEWMAFFNDLEERPLAIMTQKNPVG